MKILTKIYQQNLDCRTELIEIGIPNIKHYSGSIEKKVITTMKGGFCFTIVYDKQVK